MAMGRDQYSNGYTLSSCTFMLNGGLTLVSQSGASASIRASAPGSASIGASCGGVSSGALSFSITSIPTKITITANGPTVVPPNTDVSLTADVEDAYGNSIPNAQVSWMSLYTGGCTVSGSGLSAIARVISGCSLSASVSGVTTYIGLTVTVPPPPPPPPALVLSSVGVSASDTIIQLPGGSGVGPGGVELFRVKGAKVLTRKVRTKFFVGGGMTYPNFTSLSATPRDQNGSPMAGAMVNWTVSDPYSCDLADQGNGSATIYAFAVGGCTATATSGGKSGSIYIQIVP